MSWQKNKEKIIAIVLVLFCMIQGNTSLALAPEKLKFRHITEENGLTNSHIYCVGQDGNGFIWIGTEDGLYRYDGYHFRRYVNIPGDTTSINSNVVFRFFHDSKNNIWVGTFMGLMRYDEVEDRFYDLHFDELFRNGLPVPINDISESGNGTLIVSSVVGIAFIDTKTYKINFEAPGSPVGNFNGRVVMFCQEDRSGNFWIATDKGIDRIDKRLQQQTHFNLSSFAHKPFNSIFIHRIYEDSHSNIWITTREEGIFKKPAGQERFIQYYYQADNKYSLGSNETYDIWEDESQQIWIGTNGGGLNLYQESTGRFIRVKHAANNKNSLLNNNIRTIFRDNQGNIWIVSFQAGVNILVNHPQLFRYYDFSDETNIDYQSSTVISIFLDDKEKLWVGTDGGGLKLFDRKKNSIHSFLPNNDIPGSFPDKVVMTIYKDRDERLWFGTYQGGLVEFNRKTQKFISYKNNPANNNTLSNNFVSSILEDRRGNFWIGTTGGGLNLFDRNTGRFRAYLHDPADSNSIIDDFINDLQEDHNSDIWIATYWGLSRLNTNDYSFTNFLSDKSNKRSLSHNTVFSLFEDTDTNLWIGTRNGLNLFDFSTSGFVSYTEKAGLSGNVINSILGDKKGNLWISTNKGLTKFNRITRTSINFTESDGLQGNEFFRNSSHEGRNNEFFFGGINGFNSFFPDSVKPREYIPPVVITGFRIFEHEVPIGVFTDGRKILEKSILETNELKLRYSDKIFSFELAAIDFITPENIVYAYKMEGFDNDWNYTDARYPIITYTNLSPGDYTLQIKAANRNIIESVDNFKYIRIRITPPLWQTWWAYLIYFITIISIAFYFWRLTIRQVKERNIIKLEKLKREKAEEVNQAKLQFFTNISHEFRTPLTLIIGPLEQMLRKSIGVQPFSKQLDIILKNARRMLRLVNQLLDFRKIEGNKMTLRAEYSDVVAFINDIVHSFEEYAVEKRINFKFITEHESLLLWFDPDKLDKILFNLLSNAFKYTPEKGKITIDLKTIAAQEVQVLNREIQEYLKISVTDTGIGIPEKDMKNLFEHFYQAGNRLSFHQGSGLGLSLTKNLVEVHQGRITIDTKLKEGTSFHVYLPVGDAHLSENQKNISDTPGLNKYIHTSASEYTFSEEHEENRKAKALSNIPTILIIEDNIDLRNYLQSELKNNYNFYDASNGKDGYEMAVDIMPDLIISDIMMPEMDGFQLCIKVKQNIITSHIPVVLLTAKTSTENQIEGYQSGADAYISKPFRIDQLVATVNSVIENRIRLREKFISGKLYATIPVKNTADDKFLQKAIEAVNNNLSKVEFGVLELSKELFISRVHLHRKLKAIANISPNEFIRNIRLQKAGELLLQKEFTVSEICYKVGFNSPAYFSSCFKNYYQLPPTDFVEKYLKG